MVSHFGEPQRRSNTGRNVVSFFCFPWTQIDSQTILVEIEVISVDVSLKTAGFMADGYELWLIPLSKVYFPLGSHLRSHTL